MPCPVIIVEWWRTKSMFDKPSLPLHPFAHQVFLHTETIPADVYQRLCHAREFIDACYAHPLDLDQIARQAFFSPYHFLRLFTRAFHKTPHQYLTEKRLQRARQLLLNSDLSITQICLDVGFQSLGSFSSLFQKYYGKSPRFYRTALHKRAQIIVQWPEIAIPACFLFIYGGKTF